MRVAIELSRVSGMFRCDRTDTIKSRALRTEAIHVEYPANIEMKKLLEMVSNYNPRDHMVRYKTIEQY